MIAYRDGVIASDSLITSMTRPTISGYRRKIGRTRTGGLWGLLGNVEYFDGLERFAEADFALEVPDPLRTTDAALIHVSCDGTVRQLYNGRWETGVEAPFVAEGSGREVALGAMWHGATAPEAAAAAISLCTTCGGDVQVLSL